MRYTSDSGFEDNVSVTHFLCVLTAIIPRLGNEAGYLLRISFRSLVWTRSGVLGMTCGFDLAPYLCVFRPALAAPCMSAVITCAASISDRLTTRDCSVSGETKLCLH